MLFIVVVVYTFFIYTKNYQSKIVFVPQVTQSSNLASKLGSLASFAGLGAANKSGGEEITPILYSEIIKSKPFLNELSKQSITLEVEGKVKKIIYRDYFLKYKSKSITNKVKSFLVSLFKKEEREEHNYTDELGIVQYSKNEMVMFKSLLKSIYLKYNEDENIITLGATSEVPETASELVYYSTQILKKEIIKLKIAKAKKELEFIEERYKEKEKEFKKDQLQLASFEDRNSFLGTSKSKIKLLDLRSKYNLSFEIYSQLEKELESAKLEINQQTPTFIVIEPIFTPTFKTGMSRLIILIIGFVLCTIFSVGYFFVKIEYKKIKESLISSQLV